MLVFYLQKRCPVILNTFRTWPMMGIDVCIVWQIVVPYVAGTACAVQTDPASQVPYPVPVHDPPLPMGFFGWSSTPYPFENVPTPTLQGFAPVFGREEKGQPGEGVGWGSRRGWGTAGRVAVSLLQPWSGILEGGVVIWKGEGGG
eukprot:763583-Hanusia_phi.AAC.4